ncbi:MAG: mRNA interferase EndoA [Deltaproteobacteria bacterium ADurb.Bin026]|jgi:mRNA-degrading endonuclease toxin of MazEF toxin-antitoxin module|nr:type II toxin-antitoxin system PemK/MazF family toxin [Syntrophorhabdaceae bacterium]MDI9560117.1 type II toxin-antitoxin system PemK/MazF family toxin [Pseudomonadota bacterium]OQC53171.1 MAG: mRNA interferase EndoA [Deltaproteobacteria bacterium ADurb.Bin026]
MCIYQPGDRLKKDSIVNLSQIRTIDNRRLIGSKIVTLSDDIMKKVDKALKNSLAL